MEYSRFKFCQANEGTAYYTSRRTPAGEMGDVVFFRRAKRTNNFGERDSAVNAADK